MYLLALTALKHLGRNPMGSQPLFHEDNLKTLFHHTALPFPPPSSPFSHPPPERHSLHALEALRILGNLLIIHPTARNRVAAAGLPKAVALALANRSGDGEYLEDEDENIDRVFLVSRVGFLVTVGRQQSVKTMVDEDEIIESLAYVSQTKSDTTPRTELMAVAHIGTPHPGQLRLPHRALQALARRGVHLSDSRSRRYTSRKARTAPMAHPRPLPFVAFYRPHPTASCRALHPAGSAME